MGFEVTKEAAEWYIKELDLQEGDYVQFYVKLYGGIPTIHPSYFLGVVLGKEGNIAIQDKVNGITFYFDQKDAWFLENYHLKIVAKNDDVDFVFNEN